MCSIESSGECKRGKKKSDLRSDAGQVDIPSNFNLGHYLTVQSSETISTLIQIAAIDWVVISALAAVEFFAWYFSKGLRDHGTDLGLAVFWIFDFALVLCALAIDYKLHWIVCQLIPVSGDHELDREASLMGGVKSFVSGVAQGVLASFASRATKHRKPSSCSSIVGASGLCSSSTKSVNPLNTCEGMLQKRGRINTAYQARFFVLANGDLSYYMSEDAYTKGCRPNGCVKMMGTRVQTKASSVQGFPWTVIHEPSKRTLDICSFSKMDRDRWVQAIHAHSKSQQRTARPMCEGSMRKRGRLNTAYQDRFFVLFLNGVFNYYEVLPRLVYLVCFLTCSFHIASSVYALLHPCFSVKVPCRCASLVLLPP